MRGNSCTFEKARRIRLLQPSALHNVIMFCSTKLLMFVIQDESISKFKNLSVTIDAQALESNSIELHFHFYGIMNRIAIIALSLVPSCRVGFRWNDQTGLAP